MKIYKYILLFALIFSNSVFSNEINLWKGFNYGMSPSEVLNEISKTEVTSVYGNKTKIGFKPTIVRKQPKRPDYSVSVSGYCSIYANEKMRVLSYNSYIQWCFDKPFSRKEVDETAKLKYISIKIHNSYADIKSKITSRYNEIYPYDWYRSLKVENHLLDNCTSHYGVTFLEKGDDILIAHKRRMHNTDLSKTQPWIMFFNRDEMIESLLFNCQNRINDILKSDEI